MRRIAIIGAGQAGLILGMSLLKTGYDVTIYSDVDSEGYLKERGRPTAGIQISTVEIERKLGMNLWDDVAPIFTGGHVDLCALDPFIILTVRGDLPGGGMAVDQRLKFSQWLNLFEQRGGCLIIESITLDRLDHLTTEYDLVIVAVGKGTLTNPLFDRDAAKSVYEKPRRNLFMYNAIGFDPAHDSGGQDRFKFSFIPGAGEIFWIPFYDRDCGPSKCFLLEAIPGGPFDVFNDVTTIQEGEVRFKKLVDRYLPWENQFLKNTQPTHEISWLKGSLTPTVRKPVGTLPSGRHVMGLGDVVILNDPIAGQGANNATKMADHVAQRIIERGIQPFDAQWMQSTFDEFWEYSRFVNEFNNTFLEPLQPHQQDLMITASRRPEIADHIMGGFNHPPSVFPWFTDATATKTFLRENGISALDVMRYKLGVVSNVLPQKLFGWRK